MRILLFVSLLLACSISFAQDPEKNSVVFPDSLKTPWPDEQRLFTGSNILYREITAGILTEPVRLHAPAFDISQYLAKGWQTDYSYFDFSDRPFFRDLNLFSAGLPYYHSGTIFHQGSIRLNEKVVVGGNSFGLRSVLNAPLPHPGASQWDIRGASMFMQYKVNRNFRIETRISVTNNYFHP